MTVERMSGADAMMLYLDRAEAYNHTIKISIIDPAADPEGWSWQRFKTTWASRLGLIPRLRQRYLRVPMGLNHPVWVDDPDFNMDYHLCRVGCPAPGSMVELSELVCEFYARPMDHTRPLWQVWVVEGLEGGRVAVILFIHHALTDGVGILRMLDQFWNTRPESEEHPSPAEWHPAPLPGRGRLLADGLRDLPGVFAANLPGAIRGTRAGRRILEEWRAAGRTLPPVTGDAQYPAPYAVRLSPRRTFAMRSFSLPRIRAIAKAHGVTINDVFIAAASGAIRELRIEQDGKPPSEPMVATVPFSLVPLAERTRDGNFSTVCHTLLHTEIADPLERLRACKRDADTMKAYFEATREANVAALMSLLPPAVPKIVDRINEMKSGGLLPFWNVVLSNVPGPRTPLRLGKLRLAEWYSIGQLAHGAALNVTVWSYVDQFNLSVLSDPTVLPDAWRLVERFDASLVALESSAAAGPGTR
jgi:diacylglycerol O-acyltransferase / wax synthase